MIIYTIKDYKDAKRSIEKLLLEDRHTDLQLFTSLYGYARKQSTFLSFFLGKAPFPCKPVIVHIYHGITLT